MTPSRNGLRNAFRGSWRCCEWRQIANPVVRNMGTIGGSIAFADPAADYHKRGPSKRRDQIAGRVVSVPFRHGFVVGTRRRRPGRSYRRVVAAASPVSASIASSRVTSDFAIASVAVRSREVSERRIAIGGCRPKPVRLDESIALSAKLGDDAAVSGRRGTRRRVRPRRHARHRRLSPSWSCRIAGVVIAKREGLATS